MARTTGPGEDRPPDPRDHEFHPRRMQRLIGHGQAEKRLLDGFMSNRMHHAWMLAGPKGIGKATLAYRFARFVLKYADASSARAAGATGLAVPAEDNVSRLLAAGAHPDCQVIERAFQPKKSPVIQSDIAVDVVRNAIGRLSMTPAFGGWRVCIVDSADELGKEAANALLKTLEEPPNKTVFVLVAHAAGRILPTIRSRVSTLTMAPLNEAEIASVLEIVANDQTIDPSVPRLAQGSAGRALRLAANEGAKYFDIFEKMAATVNFDKRAFMDIADALSARAAQEEFDTFCELLSGWIMRNARSLAISASRRDLASRWSQAQLEFEETLRTSVALNLDKRWMLFETFNRLETLVRTR